jgi:hypothetical protein
MSPYRLPPPASPEAPVPPRGALDLVCWVAVAILFVAAAGFYRRESRAIEDSRAPFLGPHYQPSLTRAPTSPR